ncbi:hypothetical protein PDN64_27690 [Bacillus cereus group sp. Bc256]|uniref:hypothetical protein n=1 Tax=Bacillus cereus group TaxID=86661 RepID=UPI0022E0A152|nr:MULTISPECIES: hypothetical protein [Bacillus cereus group]MDA2141822.1 hypothetical protein [Bacillus cereus group sp. Bc256]MDH2890444.1 hypothetical protein [Bacillus cytotoxicus]
MADFIVGMINVIIKAVGGVIGWIFELFPDSPFSRPKTPPDAINLSWFTWIFDFPTWIVHLTLLCAAVATYYIIRVLARWIKVVRS